MSYPLLCLHMSHAGPQISLVCIDEVHLLNEARGSALEAGVVSRIKRVSTFWEMQQARTPSKALGAIMAVRGT